MDEKAKTSMTISRDLWTEWLRFVVGKTGATRTVSMETEKALREYIDRHKDEVST